ncbi:AAA family ATPase [Streptomyces beijiangensis]|uniref:AAA family ATPase n=1 Tax=Streptomyces beijiangensis TaxID=163361 RepID=A0A939FH32_9ACTN|nr:AAA family ATPase [Streptomyces beijiangensis]MBO0517838.1 AAA family ATPase [Streptomyces beijiangensis]
MNTEPERTFLIISGLPASGKTTLANSLAPQLGWPVIDKDTILESLYDALGVGDATWRHRLSRAADDVLFALAESLPYAILVNWWHHTSAPQRLATLNARLIEIHCDIDPATAAHRFHARTRHPGHLDADPAPEELAARIATVKATYPGPLRLGGLLLRVDTTGPVNTTDVLHQLKLPARPIRRF